jgi:hypothetical protein
MGPSPSLKPYTVGLGVLVLKSEDSCGVARIAHG